jgi:hypothetical protein
MPGWNFPPGPSVDELIRRLQDLGVSDEPHVGKQHVVSRVLLKQFSAPGRNGHCLIAHHREHGPGRPKSVRECGKAPNLLRAGAASAERLWKETEDKLPRAITAAQASRTELAAGDVKTLKDAIALHLVRSLRYMAIHEAAFAEAAGEVRQKLLNSRSGLLESEFARRHSGLRPAGAEALNLLLDSELSPWQEAEESGLLGRVYIESMYVRMRQGFDGMGLELGRVPPRHSLLIGDSPAVPIRFKDGQLQTVNCAVGDSHTVVLPLTPHLIVVLGPEDLVGDLTPGHVSLLNEAQLIAAKDYVYYPPRSPLAAYFQQHFRGVLR